MLLLDTPVSMFRFSSANNPTNHFAILEPQDQEIGEFHVVHEGRATDFEAPKL